MTASKVAGFRMQQGAAGGDSAPQWEYRSGGLGWTSKTSRCAVRGTSPGLLTSENQVQIEELPCEPVTLVI